MGFQYRPSQWSWRRGEARYTAATIHMWWGVDGDQVTVNCETVGPNFLLTVQRTESAHIYKNVYSRRRAELASDLHSIA